MPTETDAPLLIVEPLPGYEPTIGRWLWQLEDTRRETKEALSGLAPATLDWAPDESGNSIGDLLYHVALIELDWLYTEVLNQQPWPQEVQQQFAFADRDAQGHLSSVQGVALEEHLRRLDLVREHLLASFRGMTLEEFRHPHPFPDYRVTAEWVLHHLVQHEVEHRGHIQMLRSLAEGALDGR
ncbi:MAG: DinB family protein [Ktedonobacterales bacterium]